MSTPSNQLAQRIVDRLLAENLIRLADAARLAAGIAQGKARAEDWRLAVEKALPESGELSGDRDG